MAEGGVMAGSSRVAAGSGGGITAYSRGIVTAGWAILGGGGGGGGVTVANTLCSFLATSLYCKSTNTVSTPLGIQVCHHSPATDSSPCASNG